MMKRRKSIPWTIFIFAIAVMALLWTLFPIYWMISTGLKTPLEVMNRPPSLWPVQPSLEGYAQIITGTVGVTPIYRFFINSVITSFATVFIATAFAVLAAYALSRLKFRFRKSVMMGVLMTQMFPMVVLLAPLYILYVRMDLLNTYRGLVLAFTSFALPFVIWMLKAFIDTIPQEIDQAAIVDGASTPRILWQITIPLIMPGIVATAVFAFLDAWNNLLFALTLVDEIGMRTLTPGLILAFDGEFKHDWSGMMATSSVVALPVVLVFILLQKYLIEGLTAGSVKD